MSDDKFISIIFINVGYGEAILVLGDLSDGGVPGFVMLIDGGSTFPGEFPPDRPERISVASALRKLNIDHIDVMVCTHMHEDHVSGLLQVSGILPVGEFWQTHSVDLTDSLPAFPDIKLNNAKHKKFAKAVKDWYELNVRLKKNGTRIRQITNGFSVTEPGDISISVLSPCLARAKELDDRISMMFSAGSADSFVNRFEAVDADLNNYSLMLLLEFNGKRILLPGDVNKYGYGNINGNMLKADVFKIGHHGQKDGISDSLFRRINPEIVVCCGSSDRRHDSADPGLLKIMADSGAKILFSDCPDVPDGVDKAPKHSLLYITVEREMLKAEYV